jgi:hypothetical protein
MVTHRLGPGTPVFVCLVVRLRDRESNLVEDKGWCSPGAVSSVAHHPAAVTSNDASIMSRRPTVPPCRFPLLVAPSGGPTKPLVSVALGLGLSCPVSVPQAQPCQLGDQPAPPNPKLGPHPPDRPAPLPIPTLQVAARFGKPSSVSRAARRACQAADYACRPRSPAASSRGVRLMRRMPCWSISRRTVLRWAPSSAVPRPGAHPRTSSRSARYTPRSAKPSWEARAVSRRSVAWRRWRANRSARGSSLTPTWRKDRLTVH